MRNKGLRTRSRCFCSVVLVRVIGVWVFDFGWRSEPSDSNQMECSSTHDITFERTRQRTMKAHSQIRLCEDVRPGKEVIPERIKYVRI